jgi:hypothetical protein
MFTAFPKKVSIFLDKEKGFYTLDASRSTPTREYAGIDMALFGFVNRVSLYTSASEEYGDRIKLAIDLTLLDGGKCVCLSVGADTHFAVNLLRLFIYHVKDFRQPIYLGMKPGDKACFPRIATLEGEELFCPPGQDKPLDGDAVALANGRIARHLRVPQGEAIPTTKARALTPIHELETEF